MISGVLERTSLGPIPEPACGPSVWRGNPRLYRTMWLAIDTCGACFGPMGVVAFPPKSGSLSSTYRCHARAEPIAYSFWNECGPGGRPTGYTVDPMAVEQTALWPLTAVGTI